METEQNIQRAKSVLRKVISGNTYNRVHQTARQETAARIRALEHICGDCKNLELVFDHIDGKDRVKVKCRAKLSPTTLYVDTPLGEAASCPSFVSKK